ncbi:hypothetical protein [Methylobacterium sp. D48H]|jgi:hypothetical protein
MPTDTPTKPPTPAEQIERFETVVAGTEEAHPPKKPSKLGAEKLTPEEQRRRFIEAAREAGASEDEADFDAALKRITKPKKPG